MTKQDIYFLPIVKALPDKLFLKLHFLISCKKILNLSNPITYNEKIQWLKLYDRNLLYAIMADKAEAKKYVADKIGKEHIIETYGVWNSFDEIDFEKLPNQFVLKSTHDSGGVVICKDKSTFDFDEAKQIINKSLKRNYYYCGREWAYKNIKPRIIAEKYMVDESGRELKDYKVFCFSGEPEIIQVDYDRFSNHRRNLYSTEWEYIEGTSKFPTDKNHIIEKPAVLNEMLDCARILSKGLPQIRVDFYVIKDKLYFGELTLYHGSGFEKYEPEELGVTLGNLTELPKERR